VCDLVVSIGNGFTFLIAIAADRLPHAGRDGQSTAPVVTT
jgi:hypothetical protein